MADNEQFADYLGQLQEAQFPRWTDLPQFDLYMDSESDCRTWGRKRNYKVYILK